MKVYHIALSSAPTTALHWRAAPDASRYAGWRPCRRSCSCYQRSALRPRLWCTRHGFERAALQQACMPASLVVTVMKSKEKSQGWSLCGSCNLQLVPKARLLRTCTPACATWFRVSVLGFRIESPSPTDPSTATCQHLRSFTQEAAHGALATAQVSSLTSSWAHYICMQTDDWKQCLESPHPDPAQTRALLLHRGTQLDRANMALLNPTTHDPYLGLQFWRICPPPE